MTTKRLIETAFPLAEASAASLHEKNMRHGHISTLHLWPARRPLAACRAAISAALLPDPGDDTARNQIVRRLGGKLVARTKNRGEEGGKVEAQKLAAEGGILWWGQEDAPDLGWFREQILNANGGRPARVLDPFAGGGAIPLEAMRLGCEVTANDLNPVAWLLLKCTLEHPQKLGGERVPLPDFALRDAAFMESFLKAHGFKPGARLQAGLAEARGDHQQSRRLIGDADQPWLRADLGWHVRAWGQWVLAQVRSQLSQFYPTYAEWMALAPGNAPERRAARMLEPDSAGRVDADVLNRDIKVEVLKDPRTSRWIAKPTVAYLWARTVKCKSCRAIIPLLKTRWLCRKEGKRVRLTMAVNPDRDGVTFDVENSVPVVGHNAAARKASDKELGAGTMSRTGTKCPCCGTIMSSEDIRYAATSKPLGAAMTAVVVEGPTQKEYRSPYPEEIRAAHIDPDVLNGAFSQVPFGMPTEAIPLGGSRVGGGSPFSTPNYGLTRWCDLFTSRQLLAMARYTQVVRGVFQAALDCGYSRSWAEALWAYLALANDQFADRSSTIAHWDIGRETIVNTFSGFRLPMSWDFAESSSTGDSTGSYSGALEWIGKVVSHAVSALATSPTPTIEQGSALKVQGTYDAVITDPPYYDAIPYSDLMDFFYVWLRRSLFGLSPEVDAAFAAPVGPKWDHGAGDGELIDDSSRFGGSKAASKRNFEDGMAAVFKRCADVLTPEGILVIVFANKNPDAWETLVGALIRAGFVVDGSLPIQTEMGNRTRAQASAALSSSVWLVCRKRPATTRPSTSGRVVEQMRENISIQMRRFWEAGIRGPDFLWAATGPALEAYSRYPVVYRETSATGHREPMPVTDFLREVRRLVVEFAVARVLRAPGDDRASDGLGLDDVTTYYLLHRDSFGMEEAPVGACILYAVSCGLSDASLADRYEILARAGGGESAVATDADDADEGEVGLEGSAEPHSGGSGSMVRLRRWDQRTRRTLGLEGYAGGPVPMIDRVHRTMQLWKEGDLGRVNSFLDQASVLRDPMFARLVQALIELARHGGKADEAVLLESISNHLHLRSGISAVAQAQFAV